MHDYNVDAMQNLLATYNEHPQLWTSSPKAIDANPKSASHGSHRCNRARLHEKQNQILIKITHLSQRCMQILISSQFLQEIIILRQK
jgi:hypothetical protein